MNRDTPSKQERRVKTKRARGRSCTELGFASSHSEFYRPTTVSLVTGSLLTWRPHEPLALAILPSGRRLGPHPALRRRRLRARQLLPASASVRPILARAVCFPRHWLLAGADVGPRSRDHSPRERAIPAPAGTSPLWLGEHLHYECHRNCRPRDHL